LIGVQKFSGVAVFLSFFIGFPAFAQDPQQATGGSDVDLVEAMTELEAQLDQMVISITKTKQRAEKAPAVITVVNAEEIQARGYRSLADVLRTVPGFYDVYDLATHNVGVRGVNGGARASGNVIKVMIDGMPVDFSPTTGNFFGEELIPLAVVERVEIIRGPASALYGANAFLGVVNVITKKGESLPGVRLGAEGSTFAAQPGGGGQLVVGGSSDRVDVLAAASYGYSNRSGLELPSTSPRLSNANDSLASRGASEGDISRPRSFFGRLGIDQVAGGKLSFLGSIQDLDTRGEFLDYGPLSHNTRINLVNQDYRLSWDKDLSDSASLHASAQYLSAAPGSDERIDIGRSDYLLRRRVAADGVVLATEAGITPLDALNLRAGVDFQWERHELQTFDIELKRDVYASDGSLVRSQGTIIPGDGQGDSSIFRNLGAWAQGILDISSAWSATAGARVDVHNVYGANPSARAGLVWAPEGSSLSGKLLYGSSFKAPSAEQLFTKPMTVLDIQGSPDLKAQTAHIGELAVAWKMPGGIGEVTGNLFVERINGRVEFIQTGLYLEAQNVQDEWLSGGEIDMRFFPHRSLQLRLATSGAHSLARETDEDLEGAPEVGTDI
jgi:iron complex outermembrane receptor protein